MISKQPHELIKKWNIIVFWILLFVICLVYELFSFRRYFELCLYEMMKRAILTNLVLAPLEIARQNYLININSKFASKASFANKTIN